MCAYRKAILTIGMQLHAMSLRTISGLQIFFKIGGLKWPVEQKMVGHFLKWWAQAYQTNLKYTLPTHWHRHLYAYMYIDCWLNSKTCLKGHLKMKINYRLMLVKSIAECSKGSILQSFWPSLNYHLLFRSLFCLFLSGCLRHVLLYWQLFCAVRRLTVRWIFFLLKWDFSQLNRMGPLGPLPWKAMGHFLKSWDNDPGPP